MTDIRPEFAVHILNEEGIQKAKDIAFLFSEFLDKLESYIGPPGREVAIVKTKLEEAGFFAKKAMSRLQENRI